MQQLMWVECNYSRFAKCRESFTTYTTFNTYLAYNQVDIHPEIVADDFLAHPVVVFLYICNCFQF
jgi:hypothetical protein